MNGKFLLVLFICLNIATLIGSAVCETTEDVCGESSNVMLNLFVDTEELKNDLQGTSGGVGFNSEFNSNVSEITNQQSAGTNFFEGASLFIDGLLMVLGLLALLTPFPMLAFFATLGFPIWVFLIVGLVPVVLYIMAIVEFIRGGSGF